MLKEKKQKIMSLVAQCTDCNAVEFVRNKRGDTGWQKTFVTFDNLYKYKCPECTKKQ